MTFIIEKWLSQFLPMTGRKLSLPVLCTTGVSFPSYSYINIFKTGNIFIRKGVVPSVHGKSNFVELQI